MNCLKQPGEKSNWQIPIVLSSPNLTWDLREGLLQGWNRGDQSCRVDVPNPGGKARKEPEVWHLEGVPTGQVTKRGKGIRDSLLIYYYIEAFLAVFSQEERL